jgi:hypothetical protein
MVEKIKREKPVYKAEKCFKCGKSLEDYIPIMIIHPKTKAKIQLCTKECYYAVMRGMNIKY